MTIARMSVAELEQLLHIEFPQAFSAGDIAIEGDDGHLVCFVSVCSDRMLRPGPNGVGPTLMALADFAM